MAKVIVTADIDVPCGTPSLVRLYRASPEAVTAPRAHIAFIVAAGRGTEVKDDNPPAGVPAETLRSNADVRRPTDSPQPDGQADPVDGQALRRPRNRSRPARRD